MDSGRLPRPGSPCAPLPNLTGPLRNCPRAQTLTMFFSFPAHFRKICRDWPACSIPGVANTTWQTGGGQDSPHPRPHLPENQAPQAWPLPTFSASRYTGHIPSHPVSVSLQPPPTHTHQHTPLPWETERFPGHEGRCLCGHQVLDWALALGAHLGCSQHRQL